MAFSLSKFFDPLTYPMGLVWVALVLGCLRSVMKLRVRSSLFFGILVAFMSGVGSTKWPAAWLASLERPYVQTDLTKVPVCDAVVMLGGTHDSSVGDAMGLNVGEGADRFVMAVELMRMGKGKVLLLGGGGVVVGGRLVPEAELLQQWAVAWKLLGQPVENLGICANTQQEAARVAQIVKERGWKRVVLVTSGYHMKRAEAVFRQSGVDVVPVGCDFKGQSFLAAELPFTIFPRHIGFDHLRLCLHEQVGWYYYQARGWISTSREVILEPATGGAERKP